MSKWTTISIKEIVTDIKIGPHKWKNAKSFHWEYCGGCGIIAVNNEPTRRLIRKKCGTFW